MNAPTPRAHPLPKRLAARAFALAIDPDRSPEVAANELIRLARGHSAALDAAARHVCWDHIERPSKLAGDAARLLRTARKRLTSAEGHTGVIVKYGTDRANRSEPTWARSTLPPRGATHQGPRLAETLPADFSVRLFASADCTVLVVCGELDMLTAAAFGGRPGHLVVIDFAGVTFIGASALGQLARILPRLRAVGSELAIVFPSPMAYKVLDLTGFTAEMHVEQPPQDGP